MNEEILKSYKYSFQYLNSFPFGPIGNLSINPGNLCCKIPLISQNAASNRVQHYDVQWPVIWTASESQFFPNNATQENSLLLFTDRVATKTFFAMYEITKITWKVSSTERKKWIPAPLCALFCIMVGRKVDFHAVQNYVFVFLVWCSKFW